MKYSISIVVIGLYDGAVALNMDKQTSQTPEKHPSFPEPTTKQEADQAAAKALGSAKDDLEYTIKELKDSSKEPAQVKAVMAAQLAMARERFRYQCYVYFTLLTVLPIGAIKTHNPNFRPSSFAMSI